MNQTRAATRATPTTPPTTPPAIAPVFDEEDDEVEKSAVEFEVDEDDPPVAVLEKFWMEKTFFRPLEAKSASRLLQPGQCVKT